ncbi:S8 family serine peptidase [Larkinella soli]|uniref:S8 family serine peptidase n=1 Tax=Larkinella soli TaxID=1770527 RepID=UPI000FFC07E6|nr:S8 family serine peptidase [Larkinella soli]
MSRIFKIFATGSEQEEVARRYRVIERYEGFVLTEVPDETAREVPERYLAEDLTDQYTIRAGRRTIDTDIPRLDLNGIARAHPAYEGRDDRPLPKGDHHFLVQFIGPVKKEWLTAVRKKGAEPREPYGDFTYVVRTAEENLAELAALPFVRWTGHLPYEARLDDSVFRGLDRPAGDVSSVLPRTRIMPGVYTVEFFGPDDVRNAVPAIKKLGLNVLVEEPEGKLLVVQARKGQAISSEQIDRLSEIHGVRKIRERAINRPSNDVAAGFMGTAQALSATALNLSGAGEIIGICDTGLDTGDRNRINRDFAQRVKTIKSYPITSEFDPYITNPNGDDGGADFDSGHGTHVAGSVLGDGTNSVGLAGLAGSVRGLAYKARLVFQAVEQELKWKNPAFAQQYGRYLLAGIPADLKGLFRFAYQQGARIHSNSWGGGNPGEYDEQCRQLDEFAWEKKDFCVLVAAGNDGTDNDGDGKINPMSVTSPATAKNCITVGACENRRPNFNASHYGDWWPQDYPVPPISNDPMADNPEQVVAFSSRGPTQDNRIKPEVVAPGTFILSTRSSMIAINNTAWAAFPPSRQYFFMGGTSMATPLAAGAVALIREFLRKKRAITRPTAALLKAALITGATRLPDIEPDAVADNHQGYGRVNLDAVLSPPFPAVARFREVKRGLTTGRLYTETVDVKSDTVPLRVVLAYTDYPGTALINNLNLILTAPDGRKWVGNQKVNGPLTFDSTNNVEVVQVLVPVSGSWKIEVIGSNIPQGPQPFALVSVGHF